MLEHFRKTHFAPGNRGKARTDARAIARFLKDSFGARVIGIGSAFAGERRFRPDSDIDLVVDGLPPEHFFAAGARASEMTQFAVDLIPLESATEALRAVVEEEGVEL